jgi:hypothetical protein
MFRETQDADLAVAHGGGMASDKEIIATSPGPTSRQRTTEFISKRQTANLIAALQFADEIGLPLNVSVDIAWIFFSGTVDDRTRFARWQERLSKWARRHGFPLAMIWTREVGKYGSPHTHALIHVPPLLIQDGTFKHALERSLEPEGGPIHNKAIFIRLAYRPLGKLLYNLKGTDPKHASDFGIRPAYQGFLSGKRVGFTQNLGPGARRKATTREVGPASSYPTEWASSACASSALFEHATPTRQSSTSKFRAGKALKTSFVPNCGSNAGPASHAVSSVGAEPSAAVLAEAFELYKKDRSGRWDVRAPKDVRFRHGIFAWSISRREVDRLLIGLWPAYIASIKRIANQQYGGELSLVPATWHRDLKIALDREAAARRDFARRCEKWQEQRKLSDELRRRQMPPEERRALERKERDTRMKAINAELDERERAGAARALMEVRSHLRHGRIDRVQHLLASIAEVGSEGVTATDISHIVARRGAQLLSAEQRVRWGGEIAEALMRLGILETVNGDRFTWQRMRPDSVKPNICQRHQTAKPESAICDPQENGWSGQCAT